MSRFYALAVTLAANAPVDFGAPIEWTVASGGDGHVYDFIARSGTWITARDAAP